MSNDDHDNVAAAVLCFVSIFVGKKSKGWDKVHIIEEVCSNIDV